MPRHELTDSPLHVNEQRAKLVDPDHLKLFANVDAAKTWFEENDPEGVAFDYEVLELNAGRRSSQCQ